MHESKFYIKKASGEKTPFYLDTFVTNPSVFETLYDYFQFLNRIVSNNKIERITRLDLAIDYKKPYEELKQYLCKNMRVGKNYSEHVSQDGQDIGMYFGRGSKTFYVYDWSKKHRSKEVITRIELRLKNLVKEGLDVTTLPAFIKEIIQTHFFGKIELNNIDILL